LRPGVDAAIGDNDDTLDFVLVAAVAFVERLEPTGATPPLSGATIRPLRRSRLGGLIHEYVQVA